MIKIILAIILIVIIFLIIKIEKKSIYFVFINKKTKKYHQEECPYAKNLETITLQEAIKNGYTSCKICDQREHLNFD